MQPNALAREITLRSLLHFAMPSVITNLFINLYSTVDGVFISNLVGTDALSAVNLVSPFLNLTIALGIMLATGGSAVVSRQMGEGRACQARENFSLLIWVSVAAGFIVMVFGLFFIDPLVALLGANEAVANDCRSYLLALLPFFPPFMLQILFQSFFITAGRAGLGLGVAVLGGLINVAFDALLVEPFGIVGAGIATGLGYSIPGLIGLVYFWLQKKGSLYLVRPKWRATVLAQSFFNGSSEMVSGLAGGVTIYLFNLAMMQRLGQDGVAAITVILYADMLLTAVFLGYTLGIEPLIGYNYGEENHARLHKICRLSIGILGCCSVIIAASSFLFADQLVSVFARPGTEVFALASHGMRLFSFAFLLKGLNIFASALFTALSNGKVSAFLSLLRTFVFLAAGIELLPYVLDLTGLWIAVPVAELLAFLVGAWCYQRYRRVYHY